MASVGKKYAVAKQYWTHESDDDDDDDDSDLVVDEDDALPAVVVKEEEGHQVVNKKKRKRVSEGAKKYANDLDTLIGNVIANPDERVALRDEFIEEHPPAKKRRGVKDEKENKKPKKYNAYQMFCKNNQDEVKAIPHGERMTQLGKLWGETADKGHWKMLADEENKRIDPTYEVKAPQEKKSINPMLVWMKDRLSKMPQYAAMSKKELGDIAKKEIVKPEMIEEYKRS
jgi:hypothetical protein